ncbi:MAG: hypothetical protein ACXAEU_26535 [Candidatus Hodarchaeales archaeon]|jgi:hypothetical protein
MIFSRQNIGYIGFWYVLTGSFVLVIHFLFLYALTSDNPITIIETNWSRFLIIFTLWPFPVVIFAMLFGIIVPIDTAINHTASIYNYLTSKFFLYALGLSISPLIAATIIYSMKKRLKSQKSSKIKM